MLSLSEHTKVQQDNVKEKTIFKQVTEFCYNWSILLVVTYCADLYMKCIISIGEKLYVVCHVIKPWFDNSHDIRHPTGHLGSYTHD